MMQKSEKRHRRGPQTTPTKRPPVPAKKASAKADDFCAAVDAALKSGNLDLLPQALLRRVLTAAVKAYAAKVEAEECEFTPFENNAITATEAVVTACAIIRAADLNLFDMAMWFRRPVSGL